MFAKIVKNQYVGKSKIDFTFDGNRIDSKTLIGDIGMPFNSKGHDPFLPDYFIMGDISDLSTMELIISNPNKFKVLYVTGIPKNVRDIGVFKLKDVIWESYYEDRYRGYLFQVLDSNTPVELINPQNSNKIKIKYGT